MAHPVCGKCHSSAVYLDRDPLGDDSIACLMCGNRFPGGEGFYMSDKGPLNDYQMAVENEAIMEEKTEVIKNVALCSICKTKPTISSSSPYCASCMAKKANEKRRQAKNMAPGEEKKGKTKEDKAPPLKAPQNENMKVTIDFSCHNSILEQLNELAKDQIRPVESQIIFLLKSHLTDVA